MPLAEPFPTHRVRQPNSFRELLSLTDEALAARDIARVNLLCAEGLAGAEKIDHELCLRTIDRMAEAVYRRTDLRVFRQRPERWDFSESIFRIHVMITVLQRECGVRYNPAKIPIDVPLDMDDCFIHGIIQGQGGTCGSLPVLYVAVGRRLGYPLKLVSARGLQYGHFFARWDEPCGERFNIEVNDTGFASPPDDHYRTGLYLTQPDWEQSGSILKSKTPAEELAAFLSQRSARWRDEGRKRLEVEALAWANGLSPQNRFYREFLMRAMRGWHDQLQAMMPPDFPVLFLQSAIRKFPEGLPPDLERDIVGLTVTEFLLNDPINNERWWEPMRRGVSLPGRPTRIIIHSTPHGYHIEESVS